MSYSKNTNVVQIDSETPSLKEALPVVFKLIGDQQLQTVDLRKVHEWLEIPTPFNKWVKRRINDYGFVQDVDFISWTKMSNLESTTYGFDAVEYHASLDMAKELCMVERNDKGREARRYFLECEKIAQRSRYGGMKFSDYLSNLAELARRDEEREEEARRQAEQLKLQQDKQAELEAEQQRQAQQQQDFDDRLNQINAKRGYATIQGRANQRGLWINLPMSQEAGRLASAKCRQKGIEILRVGDDRYGTVGSYPTEIADWALDIILGLDQPQHFFE